MRRTLVNLYFWRMGSAVQGQGFPSPLRSRMRSRSSMYAQKVSMPAAGKAATSLAFHALERAQRAQR